MLRIASLFTSVKSFSFNILLACCLLISSNTYADFLGVYAGAGIWNQGYEGFVDSVSFDSNAEIDDDTGHFLYVAFEHPAPLIPNVRVQNATMSTKGSIDSSAGIFSFNGTQVDPGAEVELNLSQVEGILYKEILDNWVSLDIGMSIRRYESELVVLNAGTNAQDKTTVTMPLAYGFSSL